MQDSGGNLLETNKETVVENPTAIGFDKEVFKKNVLDNLKSLFRKTMEYGNVSRKFFRRWPLR